MARDAQRGALARATKAAVDAIRAAGGDSRMVELAAQAIRSAQPAAAPPGRTMKAQITQGTRAQTHCVFCDAELAGDCQPRTASEWEPDWRPRCAACGCGESFNV